MPVTRFSQSASKDTRLLGLLFDRRAQPTRGGGPAGSFTLIVPRNGTIEADMIDP